jgi:hypothetical protein
LKLNCTHQLLVYADDVNTLGSCVYIIKKNADALVVASKETGLERSVEKTKYIIMSRDLNAGKNNSKYLERVQHLEYLETTLTNENSIHEEIKSSVKSGNAIIWCRIFCLSVCYPKI